MTKDNNDALDMARIPPKALEEFKAIYKKEYGEELSDEEALKRATRLMTLFRAVYGLDL